MVGPGDGTAGADGHGRLRASHADREQAIDALKAAFVQGRLTKDEFDVRIGRALASRTYAYLASLTADIPGRPAARPRPAREPARKPARHSNGRRAVAAAVVCVLVAAPSIGGLAGAVEAVGLVFMIVVGCLLAIPAAGVFMLYSWLGKRGHCRARTVSSRLLGERAGTGAAGVGKHAQRLGEHRRAGDGGRGRARPGDGSRV
jgi:hypothetical protein